MNNLISVIFRVPRGPIHKRFSTQCRFEGIHKTPAYTIEDLCYYRIVSDPVALDQLAKVTKTTYMSERLLSQKTAQRAANNQHVYGEV